MPTARVLIVDDDRDIGGLVHDLLEIEGYEVQVARNGAEALAALAQWRPNVILTDVKMPVMDGLDFLQEQQRRNGSAIPVIVMAATPSFERPALEAGASAFIAKPFDLDQLLHLIQSHVDPV